MRSFLTVIKATLRTNFFQTTEDGGRHGYALRSAAPPPRGRRRCAGRTQTMAAGYRGVCTPSGSTSVGCPTMCSMGRSEEWSPYA
ncbi:hypothetical protein AB0957_11035 [Streptomyces zhihengii]